MAIQREMFVILCMVSVLGSAEIVQGHLCNHTSRNLKYIPPSDVIGSCERLILADNAIQDVSENTLPGHVIHVDLTNNGLQSIQELFFNAPDLESVNLNRNALSNLSLSDFKVSVKLRVLRASKNAIAAVACGGKFPLEHIDLSFNNLEQLPSGKCFHNAFIVNVSFNYILSINTGDLLDFKEGTVLDLLGNPLQCADDKVQETLNFASELGIKLWTECEFHVSPPEETKPELEAAKTKRYVSDFEVGFLKIWAFAVLIFAFLVVLRVHMISATILKKEYKKLEISPFTKRYLRVTTESTD